MICTSCGHENPERAKFCLDCGVPVSLRCASCGTELPAAAKFCLECGAQTAARTAAPSGERKVVTIVFADLVGSTALHERLDPESARFFMESYYRAMRGAVVAHGGTVTQLLGDGVKAVFGIPRVAEDDAIRAVRAAVAMQHAFRALVEQQSSAVGRTGLRVAVNTGEVVANDETEIIGDPVNVAARLQEQARDGDVVIGESTQALVAKLVTLDLLGRFALKGRSEEVSAYRVESLERPAGTAATAFVGRDAELARITSVYDAAIAASGARLAVMLGSPGLGKSRLIDEFARRLGDTATLLRAQCDAAGGASFAPLAEALRALPGIERAVPEGDADRARIIAGVNALLAGSPAAPEETFFVVRRLLSALAATRPLVLVIDDLHWAEPLLLDLIEHLVQWVRGAPLLLLVGARPELRNTRSSLTSQGGVVAELVTLAGLDAGAATRLAANVIGAADLPSAVAAKVLATSEGNPLFVGELVRMLVHEGALKQEGDRWVTGTALAELEMPPTIHALLAARIERLRPEDRTVLERAAVVGRSFSRSAVAELLPREATDLDARLESLRRNELIEPDSGWFLGEPALRFHHLLIRDAAYRRLLKGTRAELHARLADWIEARTGGSIEHDETIGWHLEQAHQHLLELGPLDAHGRALGERAAILLAASGRRALARDDLPLAAGLLGRALARLDVADPARADLALDWCEALLSAGDVGPAAAAIAELGRFVGDSERLRAWHTCFTGQLTALTAPQALRATVDAVTDAASVFAKLGDAAGEAKAHFVHAQAFARLGKVGACEAALDRALAAARRAGDRRRANAVLAGAPLAALWGPSPVTRASGRCLDVVRVLRISQEAPAVEAVALSCQGLLEALRGRTAAARRMVASARKMVEELGITHRLLEADVFAGRIDLLQGDAVAAESVLRRAYEGLRELGLGIDAAQAAALLARALLAQGRDAEAESLSHESETLAGDDLRAGIAWRGARAEALARRGEPVAAIEVAEAAVAIAAATDALLDHADARLSLAAALRSAGRRGDADAEERRAVELWEAKGATLLAERIRAAPGSYKSQGQTPLKNASQRRLRPNAATANTARLNAAIAARDLDALADLVALDYECVHHPTGTVGGRETPLAVYDALLRGGDPGLSNEPIATLGESLALFRQIRSISSLVEGESIDVGPAVSEDLALLEVNARGQSTRVEVFAPDHLGDAIAGLYLRHAELLAAGPERDRAQARAHTAKAMLGQPDLGLWASVFAPAIEFVDPRAVGVGSMHGAEALLRSIQSLFELTNDFVTRIDDVLGLRADALLVRWTSLGTVRASGGAFERNFCLLWVFEADGRLARWEQLDSDREAEALARFDEVATESLSERRRVRANAATAHAARENAAYAARDDAAIARLFSSELEVVDHANGTTLDRLEYLTSVRPLLYPEDLRRWHEPLASLGDTLALCRLSLSAGGIARGDFDVGAYEYQGNLLIEVDTQGSCRRIEIFAADRLGAAIARSYERYAVLLPEGSERTRAAAIAQSLARSLDTVDLDAWCSGFAETIEFVDHRLLGFEPMQGSDAVRDLVRSRFETSETVATRLDDVSCLTNDLLLMRWTTMGTASAGGGDYVAQMLVLMIFDADGRTERLEHFDADREADALARIEELTVERTKPRTVQRRVRQNAVTAVWARFGAAFAARDDAALADCFSDSTETVHHPTGTTYGRDGALDSLRRLQRSRDAEFRHEALATLGTSLGITRHWTSATGTSGGRFDVGAYERQEVSINQVDDAGRFHRSEFFSIDHLSDAVTRLYERHAEQQPEGAARVRAAAIAHSMAAMLAKPDLARRAAALAPEIEFVDHRIVGVGTVRGAEAVLRAIGALHDLVETMGVRLDELVDLREDAIVLRWTHSGTIRDGGGRFERSLAHLWVFGTDGRMTRWEQSEGDRSDELLAHLDILRPAPTASHFENAAARAMQRFERCWRARDWVGVRATYHDAHPMDDRRKLMRLVVSGEAFFANERMLFDDTASDWRSELLATRGERLALLRVTFTASVAGSGPMEVEMLDLVEIDSAGRRIALVVFDSDEVDAAHAELDARFDAAEPAAHARARDWRRVMTRALPAHDWDAIVEMSKPNLVAHDHRAVGWGTLHGPAAWVGTLQSLVELAPDVRLRFDHVRVCPDGQLFQGEWHGTRDGGAFEIPIVGVIALDAQGQMIRFDLYDPDQLDRARARFAEISARLAARGPDFGNAATRAWQSRNAAWVAGDWKRFEQLTPIGFRCLDRRRMFLLDLDRDQYLEFARSLGERRSTRLDSQVLATRGDRLALTRDRTVVSDAEVGPSESERLNVVETNEHGEAVAIVRLDPDDLDAAHAELDARFGAGQASIHGRAWAETRAFQRAVSSRDWNAITALCAPELVRHDHRLLGFAEMHGPDAFVEVHRTLFDLAPDARIQYDHVRTCHAGALFEAVWHGTRDGGEFEIRLIGVSQLDPRGLVRRYDIYDLDQLDQAFARFAELAPDPMRIPINAATRCNDLGARAIQAGDRDALRALASREFRFEDRSKRALVSGDVEVMLDSVLFLSSKAARPAAELIGSLGERIAVHLDVWTGATDGPELEANYIRVSEVDTDGRLRALILFDSEDRGAAFAEALERFAAGEAASCTGLAAAAGFFGAFTRHDWEGMRQALPLDFVFDDHRTIGVGTLDREQTVASMRAQSELGPGLAADVRRILAFGRQGLVATIRTHGMVRDGGPFENVFIGEFLVAVGRMARYETFNLADLERALARFDEFGLEHAAEA